MLQTNLSFEELIVSVALSYFLVVFVALLAMTLIHLLGEAWRSHLSPWKPEDKITLVVSVACILV